MKSEFQIILEATINQQLVQNANIAKQYADKASGVIMIKDGNSAHAQMTDDKHSSFTMINDPEAFNRLCDSNGVKFQSITVANSPKQYELSDFAKEGKFSTICIPKAETPQRCAKVINHALKQNATLGRTNTATPSISSRV